MSRAHARVVSTSSTARITRGGRGRCLRRSRAHRGLREGPKASEIASVSYRVREVAAGISRAGLLEILWSCRKFSFFRLSGAATRPRGNHGGNTATSARSTRLIVSPRSSLERSRDGQIQSKPQLSTKLPDGYRRMRETKPSAPRHLESIGIACFQHKTADNRQSWPPVAVHSQQLTHS